MSHFTVLVVGENPEDLLQPYHEFECTGEDDEYVQDVNETEEFLNEYNNHTRTMVKNTKTGELKCAYDDFCYRNPTAEEAKKIGGLGTGCCGGISYTSKDWKDGQGYRSKVHFTPDGWEKVELPYKDTMSIEEYAEYCGYKTIQSLDDLDLAEDHKYGYVLITPSGEVTKINRTNPNKKWDWYSLGGRWSDSLLLKDGTHTDSALKKDIDFEGMRKKDIEEAEQRYEKMYNIFGGSIPKITKWKDYLDREGLSIEEKRTLYHAQEGLKQKDELCKTLSDDLRSFLTWESLDDYQCTKEEFVKSKIEGSCLTFAILKDGEWFERGNMGWWAVVTNEKDSEEFKNNYEDIISSIGDDELLSVYDCHI